MGKDVSDVLGTAIGNAAREAIQGVSTKARKKSNGSLPGGKGLAAGAAGAGLMALAPLATKGVSKLVSGAAENGAGKLKEAGAGALKDAGGKLKDDVVDSVPGSGLFSGGDDEEGGKSETIPGVGKGRRMPVQQDIDIGVPVSTVYNQWTQFEEWPKFMHRLQQVSQEDESHVSFKAKVWGKTKEFKAEIVEQRPDERIEWKVTDGVTHAGVVTFHELGPRLTRVEVNLDLEPGSLLEKAARGMRFVKRAVRADLARFKGYVLMEDDESGAWRGEIEDGDVKKKRSSSGGGRSAGRGSASRSSSRSASSRSASSRSSSSGSSSSGSSSSRSGSGRSSSSGRSRGSSNGRSRSAGSSSGSGRKRSGSRS
jgi:uncharacterized membrane protein